MARTKVERNISYDDERKKYYVNLEFGRDPETGKQIKRTKTFSKVTEARAALRKHETERDQGRTVIPVQITVSQWLNGWLETVIKPNKADTTVYAYRHIMDHIVSVLGDIPLQKLTPGQIQRYYAQQMSNGLSSNTVRKHHDLLNHALKVAVVQDVLAVNPVVKVTPPKFTKKEIHFYSPEKLKLLMSLAEGDRIEILIKLAAYLGLRREEILGLTWDNVDLDNRLIHIRQVRTAAGSMIVEKDPKTATSARDLYIPDDVVITLQRERERQEQYKEALGSEYQDLGYVFCHENGRPFRPNYVSDLFSKFIKDHELPYITLHGLRHSFATMANSLGIPMYDMHLQIVKRRGYLTMEPNRMKAEYDPMVDGTRMWFTESPWYKGVLSIYRHPLMFAANSKLLPIIGLICCNFLNWRLLEPDCDWCFIFQFVYRFLYEHGPSGGFNYIVLTGLVVIGRIYSWLALYMVVALIFGKVFGIGRFRHSKEWYEEHYAAWYAVHPKSPSFAENKEYPNHEEPVQESEMRFCRHCGNPIKPDMRFCSKCGKQL